MMEKEESKEQYCVNGSRNNRSSSSYVCVREPIQNDEMFTHIHPNILLSHVTPHLQHNPYIFYPPLPCLTPISIRIHFQSPITQLRPPLQLSQLSLQSWWITEPDPMDRCLMNIYKQNRKEDSRGSKLSLHLALWKDRLAGLIYGSVGVEKVNFFLLTLSDKVYCLKWPTRNTLTCERKEERERIK